jgi:guanidinopropionase
MDFKPMSGRVLPRFSGVKTFFRLPHVGMNESYDVGILGVPFDGGVSYRPGARFAPSKVREFSSLGRGYHWSRGINVFDQLKVADIGDCPTVPISLEKSYELIEKHLSEVLALDKRVISIGGDHSITLPLLRAYHKKQGQKLNLVHFDAHLDTYPAAWGFEYHHGSFVRHAIEEGLVNGEGCIQIGIRGPLAGGDDLEFVNKHGLQVVTVDDVRDKGIKGVLASLRKLEGPTYLSFDIDCLDPVYAPGTGTPVPGGLTSYEVQKLLRGLEIKNLVGADIVEVSPPYDPSDITAITAVDVAFEILCLMASE